MQTKLQSVFNYLGNLFKRKKLVNVLSLIIGIFSYLFFVISFNVQLGYQLQEFFFFLVIPFFLIIISTFFPTSKKDMQRNLLYCLLIYLVILISFIITNPIKGLVLNGVRHYDYNMRPFQTIIETFTVNKELGFGYKTLLGSFLMLMPLSILLPLLNDKFKNFFLFFLVILLFSFTYEGIEYLLLIGTFDIDSIILNIVGASLLYLIIYRSRVVSYLKRKMPRFKKNYKFLNFLYISLFIILIIGCSSEFFIYLDGKILKKVEINGYIKCNSKEELVTVYNNYRYYSSCSGKYNVIYENQSFSLDSFIAIVPDILKYKDMFKLRREKVITNVEINENKNIGKKLLSEVGNDKIYLYNIASINIKLGTKEYDYQEYLNDYQEGLKEDFSFLNDYYSNYQWFSSIKNHYSLKVYDGYNELFCKDTYYLPKDYKITSQTCNYLDNLKEE